MILKNYAYFLKIIKIASISDNYIIYFKKKIKSYLFHKSFSVKPKIFVLKLSFS